LLDGKTRAEIQDLLCIEHDVSRRSAQIYVSAAQRLLATEAGELEQLFYLRLSQHQRDKLMGIVMSYAQSPSSVDPKVLTALTKLVQTACKLLDGRNATALEIQKLIAGPHPEVAAVVRDMKDHVARSNDALERDVGTPPASARHRDQDGAYVGPPPEWFLRELREKQEKARKKAENAANPAAPPRSQPRDESVAPPPRRWTGAAAERMRVTELEREFMACQPVQVLPPIVPPDYKSKPDQEMPPPAGVIDHSP